MRRVLAFLWFATAAAATPGFAADADVLAALEGMKRQMAAMQATIDSQAARIRSLETRLGENPPSAALSKEAALPPSKPLATWPDGLKSSGDLRLRQEYFDFYDKSGAAGPANDRSRNRFRVRLRWGLEKDFGDDWEAGFRLATGSATDNASTNQTLGNRGYFTYKDIFIERAYARYSPGMLKDRGALRRVTLGAGKVENPFLRFSTGIVWDPDVTPEGLYERADFTLFETARGDAVGLQLTAGQFVVNESAENDTDAQLYAYQAALSWSTGRFGGEGPVEFTLAASAYDYPNFSRTVTANTAGVSYLRTNTTALERPLVIDVYPEATFRVMGSPVTLWYDYAENVGSLDGPRAVAGDVHDADSAWGAGLRVGRAKKKGEWELFYGYYEIGANAAVAAFNDSDFGGPGYVGHTNRLGHKFGLGYRITDRVALGWTNFLVRPLDAVPASVAAGALDESVWRTQADVSYTF